jgi:hypothetical protein
VRRLDPSPVPARRPSIGFYERFAAKGQVERVDKIRRRLSHAAGIAA